MKNKIIIVIAIILIIMLIGILIINIYIKNFSSDKIVSEDDASTKKADCILILGAGIRYDGTPSQMLEDRLLEGIALYNNGSASKIIMSGDHGSHNYDEVNVMKQYAIDNGVPSEDIFMDHAGFSTYESMYRAQAIFGVKVMIVVTQDYHQYRALYIANKLGIDAYGVCSNPRTYANQWKRDFREIIARTKDFFNVIRKPEPTYLGDEIPVSGNGDITND
ncbi:MAG: vancomycin high temperature exclusion protein [Eubacterium sp.]